MFQIGLKIQNAKFLKHSHAVFIGELFEDLIGQVVACIRFAVIW